MPRRRASLRLQEKSTENKLIFVNGYGEGAEVAERRHRARQACARTKSCGARRAETLTDYTYYATGESNGEYTFCGTASGHGRAHRRTHHADEPKTARKVPIFRYYAYATTPATSTTAAGSELNETTLGGRRRNAH